MYDAVTERKVFRQRSQRSRSPRVFPRLNAEPLAEPIDVNSESSSDCAAYLDSDVDSIGVCDSLSFPPESVPKPNLREPLPQLSPSGLRKVRVTKLDIEKYGSSPGCPRCAKIDAGDLRTNIHHNDNCRRRFYQKYKEHGNKKWLKAAGDIQRGFDIGGQKSEKSKHDDDAPAYPNLGPGNDNDLYEPDGEEAGGAYDPSNFESDDDVAVCIFLIGGASL